jgi:glucosamine 6-phosphate synthetase-like amidotransferase/phosphosugar isomerase protein
VDAIRRAESQAEGSYAAAVADPEVPGVFAMKSGSSLYAGAGHDAGGDFVLVSSDLTAVLSKTRNLIPLAEGEGIWYTESSWLVFPLHGPCRFSRPATRRSRLSVRDTALDPRYHHYMEQEILGSPGNLERIRRYYLRNPASEAQDAVFEARRQDCLALAEAVTNLPQDGGTTGEALAAGLQSLISDSRLSDLASALASVDTAAVASDPSRFLSEEAELLSELALMLPAAYSDLQILDRILIWRKRSEIDADLGRLRKALRDTRAGGGAIYLVASGTSWHAALTAACFFDSLAGLPVVPCNPGMFRSMYFGSLSPRDLIFGITQSGETKDLVDIFVDAKAAVPGIRRVCLVNNENSRIPQELSDFYLPILCGPEIAVAATKSFMNQIAILYLVAAGFGMDDAAIDASLERAAELLGQTLETAMPRIEETAARLALKPSIHILGTSLIGLAREGALKIREVVLNHAEGYDAAEFKHGPNTILGKNTIFGIEDLARLIDVYRGAVAEAPELASLDALEVLRLRPSILEDLFADYPLVFICPPDDRDLRITVSQIHTHKIRGADIVLIAEKRPDLALALAGIPMGDRDYWSCYIEVPATQDRALFVFAATIVLQYLAYRMSVLKMAWLDALGVLGHGVHPDVPKNVSKSITVD